MGVTLNPDLIWRERDLPQKAVQSVRPLLGGAPVIFAGSVPKGLPVTLVATERMGWLRRSMVTSLAALADVPGAQGVLDFHGTLMTVIFRLPQQAGGESAVAFEPVRPTNLAVSTDWMRGEIRLLTI